MFEQETVFVLGAGASWHYGYPTGEKLVLDVVELARRLQSECTSRVNSHYVAEVPKYAPQGNQNYHTFWGNLGSQCGDLIERLDTVNPLVIDYFLGWNPSLRDIGRLMIAAVILKCDANYKRLGANGNREVQLRNSTTKATSEDIAKLNLSAFKDKWYRFVIHRLASKCDSSEKLLENKVRFITFNYDCSLELHLFNALSAIDTFKDPDIRKFISDRVLHVYGGVRCDISPDKYDFEPAEFLNDAYSGWFGDHRRDDARWVRFLNSCHEAAKGIRTIDEHDKVHGPTLSQARKWISSAKQLYILGYGFDRLNSERIGLDAIASRTSKVEQIFFTNFRDSNAVNKRVGQIAGNYKYFLRDSLISTPTGFTFEKSTRDVYEALEIDFGLS